MKKQILKLILVAVLGIAFAVPMLGCSSRDYCTDPNNELKVQFLQGHYERIDREFNYDRFYGVHNGLLVFNFSWFGFLDVREFRLEGVTFIRSGNEHFFVWRNGYFYNIEEAWSCLLFF